MEVVDEEGVCFHHVCGHNLDRERHRGIVPAVIKNYRVLVSRAHGGLKVAEREVGVHVESQLQVCLEGVR